MHKHEVFRPRLPTPSLDHVASKVWDDVYDPAEDTFILLDAMEKAQREECDKVGAACEDQECFWHSKTRCVLEVGSGSGTVITFVAASLLSSSSQAMTFATDVNLLAARTSRDTARANGVDTLDVVRSSLCDGFRRRLAGQVDLLVFNPPYVPSPDDELNQHGIAAAWAGGLDGRVVLDRFLDDLPYMLSTNGRCYIVFVPENRPDDVAADLTQRHGMLVRRILTRSAGRELLSVYEFRHLPKQ